MKRTVLIVASDHVGSSMAGPGIRAYRFAQELASDYDVTLSVPFPTDLDGEPFRVVEANPWRAATMTPLAGRFDAVVAQRLPVRTAHALARSSTLAVYDLFAPLAIEQLAFDVAAGAGRGSDVSYRLNLAMQEAVLLAGDAFLCASEKQRDLWLGALLALGRIAHAEYAADPSLRRLLAVVPFGIDARPPEPRGVLRGRVPGIGPGDVVLVWPGGIWNWFDPLTVIRAVARVAARRPEVRLFFLGLAHPNPHVPEMEMAKRAVALAEELELRDRVVFFNPGWVKYADRGAYLAEADLGVSAHFDDLETRFAFRSRLLDCLWSGLPLLTTAGDALGELVEARGLGRTLPAKDVDAWAQALDELVGDAELRRRLAASVDRIRPELSWSRAVEPLRELLQLQKRPRRLRVPRRVTRYAALRLRNALHEHGVRGAAARVAEAALGRARRAGRSSPRAGVPPR